MPDGTSGDTRSLPKGQGGVPGGPLGEAQRRQRPGQRQSAAVCSHHWCGHEAALQACGMSATSGESFRPTRESRLRAPGGRVLSFCGAHQPRPAIISDVVDRLRAVRGQIPGIMLSDSIPIRIMGLARRPL